MSSRPAPQRTWQTVAYVVMVAAAVAVCVLIQQAGPDAALLGPTGAARAPAPPADSSTPTSLLRVLVALASVLAIGQLLGRLFARIGQPPVIGEVIGGILLGPSVLGHLAPGLGQALLPRTVAPVLGTVAQLGAVLYMFLVGVELDLDSMRSRARETIGIAHAGIVAPFVCGVALALVLFPYGAAAGVSFTSFSLFLGVALSITAFPVLARILADSGMHRTDLGRLALTCAAVADVTAWCLLALVIGVAQASVWRAAGTVVLTLVFVAAMVVAARPFVARVVQPAHGRVSKALFALTLLALLISAAVTEALGVHAIFGAFLLGTLIPPDSPLARSLSVRLEDVVTTLLLPAFFAVTGLRMQVGLLGSGAEWTVLAIVVLVASAGKVGGTSLAARLTGMPWREALSLGMLMNTRGLMELIVLNIGLDLGLISPTLFTVLVLMAIVTTVTTGPALHALGVWSMHAPRPVPAGAVQRHT